MQEKKIRVVYLPAEGSTIAAASTPLRNGVKTGDDGVSFQPLVSSCPNMNSTEPQMRLQLIVTDRHLLRLSLRIIDPPTLAQSPN